MTRKHYPRLEPEALHTLIQVDSLSRYYGGLCAVSDLSFSLGRGQVLGFLGPNGAGKTTTMRILCGVLAPSSGTVTIAGEDILDRPAAAKRHLGFLPEQPPLYRDTSVDEYLCFCARLRRLAGEAIPSAVERAKQRCGLESVGRRLIGNLSRGFQQRVGIAQAIIHAPSLIVLDEPTAGLDPNQLIEIRHLIRELGREHSIILSTHILPEVQGNCDRVLILHHGRLVLDEDLSRLGPDDGLHSVTVALGRPPAAGELQRLDGVVEATPLGGERFRIRFQGDDGTSERLVSAAVQHDWRLYELIPEANSLEQTFTRLTGMDNGGEAPGRDRVI